MLKPPVMFMQADRFRAQPNVFQAGDTDANRSLQGAPGNLLAGGWWRAGPGDAIVVDFTPPECRYWSFVLSNYWGPESTVEDVTRLALELVLGPEW